MGKKMIEKFFLCECRMCFFLSLNEHSSDFIQSLDTVALFRINLYIFFFLSKNSFYSLWILLFLCVCVLFHLYGISHFLGRILLLLSSLQTCLILMPGTFFMLSSCIHINAWVVIYPLIETMCEWYDYLFQCFSTKNKLKLETNNKHNH